MCIYVFFGFFFFIDTAPTEIYTLSLHDALPIYGWWARQASGLRVLKRAIRTRVSHLPIMTTDNSESAIPADRINRAGFIGIEGACPYKGIARKQPPHDCGPKGPPANIKFTAMKEKIGFVGVGRMGANMARRLGDCGYRITAVY